MTLSVNLRNAHKDTQPQAHSNYFLHTFPPQPRPLPTPIQWYIIVLSGFQHTGYMVWSTGGYHLYSTYHLHSHACIWLYCTAPIFIVIKLTDRFICLQSPVTCDKPTFYINLVVREHWCNQFHTPIFLGLLTVFLVQELWISDSRK